MTPTATLIQPAPTVTLTMTLAQAETLMAVFPHIGGHPATTRRGHTDAIQRALYAAGVLPPDAAIESGSLYFGTEDNLNG